MASFIIEMQEEGFTHDPQHRGYRVAYHENEVNHCPGCGRTHWYVGRVSAECGFCATALPLAAATSRGAGSYRNGHRPIFSEAA